MIVAMVSAPRAQVGERGSGRSYLKEIPSHAQGIVVCGKIRDAGSCYFPQIGEIMIRFPLASSCLRRSFLFRGEISQLGKSPSFSFFFFQLFLAVFYALYPLSLLISFLNFPFVN